MFGLLRQQRQRRQQALQLLRYGGCYYYSSSSAALLAAGKDDRFVLPVPSLLTDTCLAALEGSLSLVLEPDARDEYESFLKCKVIQDTVLSRAHLGGFLLTNQLFHNLRDPLWKRHQFDAPEFCDAVGPALEHFHDAGGRLRNRVIFCAADKKKKKKASSSTDDGETPTTSRNNKNNNGKAFSNEQDSKKVDNSNVDNHHQQEEGIEQWLGGNQWRSDAERDTSSLAARFVRMTTPHCLHTLYYSAKLDAMMFSKASSRAGYDDAASAAAAALASLPSSDNGAYSSSLELAALRGLATAYVEGSCRVGEVALLNARVMEIPKNDDDEEEEEARDDEKGRGSRNGGGSGRRKEEEGRDDDDDDEGRILGVAAQMDVLYELTQTYQQPSEESSSTTTTKAAAAKAKEDGTTSRKDDIWSLQSKDDDGAQKGQREQGEVAASAAATADAGTSSSTTASLSDSKEEEGKPLKMSVTNLAVAIFEGWLHGGPGKNPQLRWKVAMIREPYEFPAYQPTITRA